MLTAVIIAMLAQNTIAPVTLHVTAGSHPVRLVLDGAVYSFKAEERGEIPTFEGTHLVTLDYGPEAVVWHGWYQFEPGVAELALWEPYFIRGQVIARGAPVAGVKVHVESDRLAYVAEAESVAARSDAMAYANVVETDKQGWFELALPVRDHYTVGVYDRALGWDEIYLVPPSDEPFELELRAGAVFSRQTSTPIALQRSRGGAAFPMVVEQPVDGTVTFRNVNPIDAAQPSLFHWTDGKWESLMENAGPSAPPMGVVVGSVVGTKPRPSPARPNELEGVVIDEQRRPVVGAAVISRCDDDRRPNEQLRFRDPADAPARWTLWPQGMECVDAITHTDAEGRFHLKKKSGALGWVQIRQGSKRMEVQQTTQSWAGIVFR